jgi:hypothetical protein
VTVESYHHNPCVEHAMAQERIQAYSRKMETNISVLTLIIGLPIYALASPAPPGGTPPAVPIIPVPGNDGVATNNINPVNTNWSNNYYGNYSATNGNGGMTNGIYGNSYVS